ncbi:MAG: RNA-binding S4 domain-containing protein [Epsilonproteobacteria bacterium]|nr:RNA-binding S4 domain-containing protein [Campylobacterota bacterium]
MRVDKFLNTVNITKRRSIAEDMCKSGVVKVNSKVAKGSKDVKVGDVIEIEYLSTTKKFQVLQIPTTKTIPKSAKEEYVKEI